jgi:hypothetical protein
VQKTPPLDVTEHEEAYALPFQPSIAMSLVITHLTFETPLLSSPLPMHLGFYLGQEFKRLNQSVALLLRVLRGQNIQTTNLLNAHRVDLLA